ncbi:YraN family protein [Ruminococcus bicirculans (ex Wegman et al. 2014)]|uniref:YraN family protein n=1 Tax=Ruminococcus bicirculans (ex Wegman et al. 2014) TaxID=1160721 RepID=UPI00265754E0
MQRKMGIDHTQRRKAGNIGEDAVCGFLVRHGYEIIKRNFTVRGGEIDIIAEKADIIAFVEVKTREHGSLTSAEEAVDLRKQRLIIRTAQAYLQNAAQPLQCRFDVAVVETEGGKVKKLRYYVNAFDASMK